MRLERGLNVVRARLRGGGMAERRPLEAALEQISVDELGLPPRAVLYVPRLAPRARLRVRDSTGFAGAVARDLRLEAQGATRCGPGRAPGAGSLLFACEADFLAWLIYGWLRPQQAPLRALAGLAGSRAPAAYVADEVMLRGEQVPALFGRLAWAGALAELLAALPARAATRSLAAVRHAHGILASPPPTATTGRGRTSVLAGPSTAQANRAARAQESAALAQAFERARAVAPEAFQAPCQAEHRALALLALGLARAPDWVRSAKALELVAALAAHEPEVLAAAAAPVPAERISVAPPMLREVANAAPMHAVELHPPVPGGQSERATTMRAAGPAEPIHTAHGGLLFALVLLLDAGLYADFAHPTGANLSLSPWLLLRRLGRRWFSRRFAADPLDPLLAEIAGVPPDAGLGRAPRSLRLEELAAGLRAQLAHRTGLAPRAVLALLRRPAELWLSDTALDAEFALDEHHLSLRLAGLDRDPGWIPAAGRAVAFHFR